MNKVAFTSDQHYWHSNIISERLCNRPFKDIIENNETIISNHNCVAYDDTWEVYMLGDIAYKCDANRVFEVLKRLNGKMNILLGNHDKPLRQAWERGLLDKMIKSGKIKIIGTQDRTDIVAKLLKIDNRTLILSHYAYRTWPSAFRGTIHLYGHSHSNLPSLYKSFDVGVDANNFFPVTLEEVFKRADAVTADFSEREV